jgi:hypothetical protein
MRIILIAIALGMNLRTLPAMADIVGPTTLKPVYGWGKAVRLGRWTCLFVTVADRQTRSCILQIHGTYGTGAAVLVRQTVVAEPRPRVYALFFPLNADPSHIAVELIDESTGKILAGRLMQDPNSFTAAGQTPLIQLAADDTLIGITGNLDDALLLQTQLAQANLTAGVIDPSRLPDSAVGLEGISVLILSGADLRELDGTQERAIVDWVAACGNLVVIPGPEPTGPESALLSALPCDIGINRAVATSPSALNGRELQPHTGAEAVQLFPGDPDPNSTAYARRLGFGRIIVLPANVAPLKFTDQTAAVDFWRNVLKGMADVSGEKNVTSLPVSDEQEEVMPVGPKMSDSIGRGARETLAIRDLLQTMRASQPHQTHDWAAALLGLMGICAILGPLDSLMMMRMGIQPRHWLIAVGWIGLLGGILGYLALRVGAAQVQIRAIRLIDQVDTTSVIATDLVAVESNRSEKLSLQLPAEWWEPANQAAGTFSPDRFLDVDLHEDRDSCVPQEVTLQAGEAQSFRGESIASAPPALRATLTITRDALQSATITGQLTNLSPAAMTDIQIQTAQGNCHVDEQASLSPGATIEIHQALSQDPIAPADLPADALDMASDQADRIHSLIKTGRFACIVAQTPDAPAISVIGGVPAVQHWQLIRALVPVGN